MKIVFASGFLNNHILPFCLALAEKNEFYFISTEKWQDNSFNREAIKEDFVINYFEEENKSIVEELIADCDVAIFGGNSGELLELRKKTNKLAFVYTERFFKRGSWRRFLPSTRKLLNKQFLTNSDNLFVLCSGAFVAKDLMLIGFDVNRCFKFGYFPFVKSAEIQELIFKKNNEILQFLWVGRFLHWKRTKDIIKCCKRLNEDGMTFELKIVGDGPERKKLEKLCAKYDLDNVHFLGAKPSKEVFELMAQSNVMYMTSNYYEGWGAVVNEALSNACPVIASNACGSAPYLIKDGINGYVYKMGNTKDLFNKTKLLFQISKSEEIYQNAYNTINCEWNATEAALRFLEISKSILEGGKTALFEEGPMSHT